MQVSNKNLYKPLYDEGERNDDADDDTGTKTLSRLHNCTEVVTIQSRHLVHQLSPLLEIKSARKSGEGLSDFPIYRTGVPICRTEEFGLTRQENHVSRVHFLSAQVYFRLTDFQSLTANSLFKESRNRYERDKHTFCKTGKEKEKVQQEEF